MNNNVGLKIITDKVSVNLIKIVKKYKVRFIPPKDDNFYWRTEKAS